MPRFQTILAGAQINDVENGGTHTVDAGTFNYFGYVRSDDSWIVMREKSDGTEFRYAMGSKNNGTTFVSAWATHNSLVYVRSNEFSNFGN